MINIYFLFIPNGVKKINSSLIITRNPGIFNLFCRFFFNTFLFLSFAGFCRLPVFAQTEAIFSYTETDDACMSLSTLPDITSDGRLEIVAGFDSGKVVCLSSDLTSAPLILWYANVNESVLALMPIAAESGDSGPDIIVSTQKGNIVCLNTTGAEPGSEVWSFKTPCGINTLAQVPDKTGDGVNEVVAGGSDQRIYIRNGATGDEIWTRFLSESSGYAYVHTVLDAGDLNADAAADIILLAWDGKVYALNGTNGNVLWNPTLTAGFTDALVLYGDQNADSKQDFLVGGNDKIMKLGSGSNGNAIWNYKFNRPIRSVLVTPDVNDDGKPDCFGATAGGEIACVSGAGTGTRTALWTAQADDVCRVLASPGDLDEDGKPDISVSAEDGTVTTYSGVDGELLWQWQAGDVVRALTSIGDINNDGLGDLAAGSLDGTVTILSGFTSKWISPESRINRKIPRGKLPSPYPVAENAPAPPKSSLAAAVDVPILLYHDVLPEMYYPYGVTLSNFISQMDLLVTGGYTPVSLDTIYNWIKGTESLPDKPICITFDGPYDGQYTYAMPVLQERGLFATVYCTGDWIGTANHTEWNHMREMNSSGLEDIQNHTINHANLTTLNQAGVEEQVVLCSESIEKHLNGKISFHHAYPGGGYNSTVMGYMRDLGFKTATTVVQRHVVKTDDLMALPRYSVLNSTTLQQFKQKIRYSAPTPTPIPTPYKVNLFMTY